MDVATWLAQASADASARGLEPLRPLLQALARSMQALRDADAAFRHPAADAPRGGDAGRSRTGS
ncbi:MAG TPA: hypothetical protein VFX12_07635 [Vicinamibacterales bacterium]|nr:hypothetical protein [Vicinamibacterales bacterium]